MCRLVCENHFAHVRKMVVRTELPRQPGGLPDRSRGLSECNERYPRITRSVRCTPDGVMETFINGTTHQISARPTHRPWENAAMSSTHHSLYYHFVFGTKDRRPLIVPEWQDRLQAFLGGCINTLGGVPTEIGGVADHVHMLVSLKPTHQISEVMRNVKHKSSEWIHNTIGERAFNWQDGYGAFTVSRSQVSRVRAYIQKQDEHHRVLTFRDEYVRFLKKHMIEFKDEYV